MTDSPLVFYDEAAFIGDWEDLDTMPRLTGWVTVHLTSGNTFSWREKEPDTQAIASYFGVPEEHVEVT